MVTSFLISNANALEYPKIQQTAFILLLAWQVSWSSCCYWYAMVSSNTLSGVSTSGLMVSKWKNHLGCLMNQERFLHYVFLTKFWLENFCTKLPKCVLQCLFISIYQCKISWRSIWLVFPKVAALLCFFVLSKSAGIFTFSNIPCLIPTSLSILQLWRNRALLVSYLPNFCPCPLTVLWSLRLKGLLSLLPMSPAALIIAPHCSKGRHLSLSEALLY